MCTRASHKIVVSTSVVTRLVCMNKELFYNNIVSSIVGLNQIKAVLRDSITYLADKV